MRCQFAPSDAIIRFVKGYDPDVLLRRREVVGEVLDGSGRLGDEAFTALAQAHPKRCVYIVAREQALRSRYEEDPRFRKLFENACAAVFGLADEGTCP